MEYTPTTPPMTIASVLLDQAIDQPLDYKIPPELIGTLSFGMRVKATLKNRTASGTVVEIKSSSPHPKLSHILQKLHDTPFVDAQQFQLCQWIATYYCCPLRKVLKSALPPSIRGNIEHKEQLFVSSQISLNQLAERCQALRTKHPKQADILDILLRFPQGILLSHLLSYPGISKSALQTLVKHKILATKKMWIDRAPFAPSHYFKTQPKTLNLEQAEALRAIIQDLDSSQFRPRLLYGVTGSGKTEVYLQAIQHALNLGKKVLFLVPEIALTSQTIEKLYSRFEEKVALLHHRLSVGEKHDTWHHILQGTVSIVVGARSAIFVPLPSLGLIIIDEEQESAYKQTDDSPTYHARDVALMRGKLCHATVLLGSATPTLETFAHAEKGKYALSTLHHRAAHATKATILLVDMRKEQEKNRGFTLFSDLLLKKITTRLQAGEQTLLFLNRRGYHTAHTCQKCGHLFTCPHCDISLTYHLNQRLLACHLCDYQIPTPKACPECFSQEDLKFKGAGTEMVEAALHALLPSVRTLRMDADTTKHKGSHETLFKTFRAGKADVLIGTQMIAKGLHFPNVTLVGVLNADSCLQVPDFRASEHMFQLTTQVAGRAGRAELPGEVIIQTLMPEHPTMKLVQQQDFVTFYQEEMKLRKTFGYPPFTHLIKLLITGENIHHTEKHAISIRNFLIEHLPKSAEILPIIPCGHAKIKGRYRFQCLIKSSIRLSPYLSQLQSSLPQDKQISLTITVDPLSTFF